MPEISVVMSVYNEPLDWIRQSINSILNQTFCDFEFIIVNDNPDSLEHKKLIHSYAEHDRRIKIIENEDNNGLTKSLNIGIAEASGKYIARMDADDISFPNRLQVQFDYMEAHPKVDVCGSFAKAFGNLQRFSSKRIIVPETNEQIVLGALVYSPMIHPAVMFRMERLPNRLYNEDFKKAQDYVLWGSLIERGFRLYNIPEFLIKYRITAKSNKESYRSQQFFAANKVRANLLRHIRPEIDDRTIELHNRICNEQDCDLNEAEKWLQILKSILMSRAKSEYKAISAIIARLWININLTNGNSLRCYRKSKLTKSVSLTDSLRFMKRDLCKVYIINKLIRGGVFLFCYLLYYGIAQYLPSNYSKVGPLSKWIRYQLVRHIFAHCGKNVDVNRRVNFGSGRYVSIGDNSGLGANSHIPNSIVIGANVMMAPNCYILGNVNHQFDRTDIPMREQGVKYTNPTVIGNDVWIGQNTLITPGRIIKDGCIIAAGTVLTKDYPEYSIIGGNPSRLIRSRLDN